MRLSDTLDLIRQLQDPDAIPLAVDDLVALAEADGNASTLKKLLAERHVNIKRAAVLAIGRMRVQEAAPTVRRLLEQRNRFLRVDCLQTLGELRDPDALPLIETFLHDSKSSVREAAAEAIVKIGGIAAIEALSRSLKTELNVEMRRRSMGFILELTLPESAEGTNANGALLCAGLSALLMQVVREHDKLARGNALRAADAIAAAMTQEHILAAARAVPERERPALALALETFDREQRYGERLRLPLARLAIELRAEAPDREKLEAFGIDLVQRARRGELRAAWHREDVLDRMIERLSRTGPRSLILVGPSGAGKTALVHALARELGDAQVVVPNMLVEITTGGILSGTRFLGDWQTRLRDLINLLRSPRRAIWYSPDVNRLLDAGVTQDSRESFAAMLAPYLERGEVTIVGECSPEQFRQGIDREASFRKHFQVIHVDASSQSDSVRILRALVEDSAQRCRRELGRGLEVSQDVLTRCHELADSYIPELVRPGNAISLLEATIEGLMERARGHDQRALTPGPFGLTRRPKASAAPEQALTNPAGPIQISSAELTRTLCERTGMPESILNDAMSLDLESQRSRLHERVLGQADAVNVMTDLIALIKSDLTDPRKPLATLFFVGPTGVGKTEMAKALAETLFGSSERLVRLDMGDFQTPDSYRRLIGDFSPAGGALTTPIRERPFSVVLLDEIEKAHKSVFDLLLPVMAEGRLSDEDGRVTDFRRSIIIMTSNIASDLSEDSQAGFVTEGSLQGSAYADKVARKMEDFFRPEFLARIDRTVVFTPLSRETMREIVRREVERALERPGVLRRAAIVDLDDSVIGLLTSEGFSDQFGARPLKRRVETLVLQPLARAFLHLPVQRDGPVVVRLSAAAARVVAEVAEAEPHEDLSPSRGELERVTIEDPLGESRLLTLEDLDARVLELRERVEDLAEFRDEQGYAERKAELIRLQSQPDFWSKGERARAVMSEVHALEKLVAVPDNLSRRLDTVDDQLDRASRGGDRRRLLKNAAKSAVDIQRSIELAEYALRCPDPKDRQDAYILLRRLGTARQSFDLCQRLAHMYLEWARRKGFQARAVFESIDDAGRLEEATLVVEGNCAYGLLRGESGLHQISNRAESQRRDIDFVRVDVINEPLVAPQVHESDLLRESRRLKSMDGVLFKRPRSYVLLTHGPTRVTVEGSTSRQVEDALSDALPVLRARLAAARDRGDRLEIVETVEQARRKFQVVRKYQLTPQPFVRDVTSGMRSYDLDGVLGGRIDDFILARLRNRSV